MPPKSSSSQPPSPPKPKRIQHDGVGDDDYDFQIPLSQIQRQCLVPSPASAVSSSRKPLTPARYPLRSRKKTKRAANPGKENVDPNVSPNVGKVGSDDADDFKLDESSGLDMIESSIDCSLDMVNSSVDCSLNMVDSNIDTPSVGEDWNLSGITEMPPKSSSSQPPSLPSPKRIRQEGVGGDGDYDSQIPLSQTQIQRQRPAPSPTSAVPSSRKPLEPARNPLRLRKKTKRAANPGKENVDPNVSPNVGKLGSEDADDFKLDESCSLDRIESSIDCSLNMVGSSIDCSLKMVDSTIDTPSVGEESEKNEGLKAKKGGYLCNSVEARLMRPNLGLEEEEKGGGFGDESSELDVLIKLCAEEEEQNNEGELHEGCLVHCPLCGTDISELSEDSRLLHTNHCIDKAENQGQEADNNRNEFQPQVVDGATNIPPPEVDSVSPVVSWLRNLGLEKYEEGFIREEIDWQTLQWLTEEDLFSIGVTALGPRKKIVHALKELRKGSNRLVGSHGDACVLSEVGSGIRTRIGMREEVPEVTADETCKLASNKLITDYFPGNVNVKKKACTKSEKRKGKEKSLADSVREGVTKSAVRSRKLKDIPVWCSIPGTPFRVDAFKYLRGDCSHWFLTHFHMDHYQGLTKSFCRGKIYCSLITAKLVNIKIGIPWDRLEVLPLNQKISIAGVDVTCLDANHCPGSILILFEPPNGKAVLHTGDFRFCEEMATLLQTCPIHTLILDTTYCNPQYDFPKQEAVIQFVIEAIQAESFNPKTLFLIGSYTIGKERLFLEVARVLRRKVYVTPAKFRLLECLGFSEDDMKWFTLDELESQIHVVPMWTLASFKRLKHIVNQYVNRFSLIVAFSPTGWTFGKGKKKSPGKRWQQGTVIRYEVPYSEHSSFEELREFVKLVSPENVIPSVNNDGPESVDTMLSLLLS